MLKNYKLNLFTVLVVAGVSIGSANAFNPNTIPTKIISNYSDNWVEVQNENGIKIYFLEYDFDGKSYLKIKFENLTGNAVNLSWSLKNKSSETILSDNISGLKSNGFTETIQSAHPVLLNNGESLHDFSIQINIK